MNQAAQTLASQGRYGDTMLVHMSPKEVGGLQALARSNGTTLTINPATGLPEAFSLRNLLPMIIGGGLTALSGGTLSPLTVGLMTGGLGALATGSLQQGLLMGLGAAGGAGIAGSAANLAAPAAAATTPVIPAAVTPAAALSEAAATAATPGLASAAPALTPATSVATSPLSAGFATAPQGALGSGTFDTVGSLTNINPMHPGNISPMQPAFTQPSLGGAGVGLSPEVNMFGAGQMQPQAAPLSVGDLAPSPPMSGGIASLPTAASEYGLMAPSELVGTTAPTPFTDRLGAGFKQAVSSPEAFGKYLSGNTMNLAMGLSPALFEQPEYSVPESNAMIRPYTLEVDNLSGRPVSPTGVEEERLRYRYTAGTPYRAAKGGIIAFAEGGNTTDGQEINTSPVPNVSPQVAQVYQSIARIQGMAGLPQLQIPAFMPSQPSPVARIAQRAYQPISYRERDYGVAMPLASQSETFKGSEEKKKAADAAFTYPYGDFGGGGNDGGMGGFGYGGGFGATSGDLGPGASAADAAAIGAAMGEAAADGVGGGSMSGGVDGGWGGDGGDGLARGGPILRRYAEGGQTKYKEVRKKIDRMEDPYKFADYRSGRGLYEAAQQNFAGGGLSDVPRFLSGGGDGMSDSIPATINGNQPARLADGEFVIPADVVSHLGNGSSKAGAKQLYAMMDRVRSKRTGKKKQAPAVNPKKMMPV